MKLAFAPLVLPREVGTERPPALGLEAITTVFVAVAVAGAPTPPDEVPPSTSALVRKNVPAMGAPRPASSTNVAKSKFGRGVEGATKFRATISKFVGWTNRSMTYLRSTNDPIRSEVERREGLTDEHQTLWVEWG